MSLLEATYDVSWAQHNYTITWNVTPPVSTSFSDYSAVMIVDQNDDNYIYIGGDTNTLTMLNYTLCTTLQGAPFTLNPNTASQLITQIQALNTGNITDGDLTVTGSLTVQKTSTLMGAASVGNALTVSAVSTGVQPTPLLLNCTAQPTYNNDMAMIWFNRNAAKAWHWQLMNVSSTYNGDLDFTETGVADGRLYLKKGGYLGVNNTSPAYSLDVTGNGHLSTDLTVDGTSTLKGTAGSSSGAAGIPARSFSR